MVGARRNLRANDIHSLLDAPVRSEGALLGVVCHEQGGHARSWTRKDEAFAASIGKLHRSFVASLPDERHDLAIVRATG